MPKRTTTISVISGPEGDAIAVRPSQTDATGKDAAMTEISELIQQTIGSDADSITWWQMALRAVLVFAVGLVLMRLVDRRAFGRLTPFDFMLTIILGSILSRAITANAPLLPSVAASAAFVLLHALLGRAARLFPAIGWLVKGRTIQLVRDGKADPAAMRSAVVTEHDLTEALREKGIIDLRGVEAAFLERNGVISVIERR